MISDLLKLLDETKYSRFNFDPQANDLNEFNPANDLNTLRLLVDYKYCLTYREYREVCLCFVVYLDFEVFSPI